jgi:hypothetical protein
VSRAREFIALRGRDPVMARWLESLRATRSVTVLDGPRGIDPRRFGVPSAGADWYLDPEGAPEPASFGLALAHLERVLRARAPGAVLAGDGQGAALALALACCWPERLAAVIAIDGALPRVPAGALDERPLDGLRVLLAGPQAGGAERLEARGARVTRDARPVPVALAHALDWLAQS